MDTARLAAGSLGPRLAGRLTAELILRSPQYMNCVKEYEIDLRGACGAALRKQAPDVTFDGKCQSWEAASDSLKAQVELSCR